MVATPPQTDTYSTALDIFDKTHPLRVDADENLKVTVAGSSISPDVNIHDSAGNALSSTGTSLNVDVTNFPAVQAVSQSGSWTVSLTSESIEIGTVDQGTGGASPWLVSGTVTANAGAGTFLVDGSAHTQPISGTITANQGTSPWVSSITNFPAVQTVSVNNFPATQPVSGTVTALQGTSPWVVSGTIITSPNVNVHDGAGNTISSTGTSLDINVTNFPSSQNVVVTNTPTVNQGTSPWVTSVSNFPATVAVTQGTSPWVVSGTVIANAGTGTFLVDGSAHTQPVSGTVTANAGTGTFLVDGSAHTQPVSGTVTANAGTGNFTVVQATGTNLHTVVDSGTITLSGTSPVSGTVTANQGTPNTAANKWPIEIVDSAGVNIATVDAAGDVQVDVNNFPATVAVTQNTSPWVVSGTVTANAGTGTFLVDGSAHTQPVSGTITANAGTGNFTVVQPTGTNLHAVVDSGAITVNNASGASAVNIQDGGNSITVDGTVAATQSGTWTVQPGNTQNTTPWLVEPRVGTISTYSATTTQLAAAALATDVFTLTGSATKTVRVTKVGFSGTETTAAVRDVFLIKRSSANSGGTSTTPAVVPHDSNNAAGTAVARAYTANPTLGATVGTIRAKKVDIEATNLVGSSDFIEWIFGARIQPIVLRGTSEVLAVNLNGVTSAGSSLDIYVEWTEE